MRIELLSCDTTSATARYNELFTQGLYATPFHSLNWNLAISKVAKSSFFILEVSNNNKAIAMLPVHRRRFRPYLSSGLWGAYGGFMLESGGEHTLRNILNSTHLFQRRPILLTDYYKTELYNKFFFKKYNTTWILDTSVSSYDRYWLDTLNPKIRNQIRKSIKSGVTIREALDTDAVNILSLYHIFCQDKNISPIFDVNFFSDLIAAPSTETKIFIAEYNGEIIAAAIFLISKFQMFYWQSYFNRPFSKLNPISGILNQAINFCFTHNDIKLINFGAVPKDLASLEFFKKNWGCQPYNYVTSAVLI